MKVDYPETPKGKLVSRQNIYGNWVGYVSGRRFWEFGTDDRAAMCWQAGSDLENAYLWTMPDGSPAV